MQFRSDEHFLFIFVWQHQHMQNQDEVFGCNNELLTYARFGILGSQSISPVTRISCWCPDPTTVFHVLSYFITPGSQLSLTFLLAGHCICYSNIGAKRESFFWLLPSEVWILTFNLARMTGQEDYSLFLNSIVLIA